MLSIIIPTLNEEHYVGMLLECYLKQTYNRYEIIVVDGGSTDNTKEVVKQFSKKSRKIKLVVSEKRNVSYQRNLGAENAKYKRLLFTDADISVKYNFLENALRELMERKLDVSGCYIKPKTKVLGDRIAHSALNGWLFLMQYFYPHMPGHCIFSTNNVHSKLNGFDPTIKFAEDNDYVNRSKKLSKFRILKSVYIQSSNRRFEMENRLILAMKYAACPFYRMLFGEIRTDLFKYRMNIMNRKI